MKKGHISERPPKQNGYAAEAHKEKGGRSYYSTASRSKAREKRPRLKPRALPIKEVKNATKNKMMEEK